MNKFLISAVIAGLLAAAPLAHAQSYAGCGSLPAGLALGSRGEGVLALQQFLVKQNYPGGGSWMATGYFGAATAAALGNFQRSHNAPPTGFLDTATAAAINAACGNSGAAYPSYLGSPYYQNQSLSGAGYGSGYYGGFPYPSYGGAFGYPYQYQPNYGAPVITSLSQNTGWPGQSVTVYGQGFDAYNNTVTFDGASLYGIPSPGGASLTFTIPQVSYLYAPAGTSVELFVSTPGGRSDSVPFTLYSYGYGSGCGAYPYQSSCGCGYYPYGGDLGNSYCPTNQSNTAAPTIQYLSPSSGPVGTTVTIYGSGFTTTGNVVHFGVAVLTGLNSYDGRSVSFAVPGTLTGYGTQPAALSTYQVSVSNGLGYASNAMPFAVTGGTGGSGAPVISSVTGPASLDAGKQGSWTVSLSSGWNQYVTFSVDWGDQQSLPYAPQAAASVYQANVLTHTYVRAGTYTITFTAGNSYGQSNSYTTTVVVGAGNPAGSSVSVSGMAFHPQTIYLPRGTVLTWTNNDGVAHTVTSDNGAFGSGVLNPGQQYQFTFGAPGTYAYHCSIHPQMTGSVVVY